MFRFFKEMIDAIKEGAAEGIEEADREIATDKEAASAEQRRRVAALERRLATTSTTERLLCAIASPYREVFLNELGAATDEDRPPIYLFCSDLPEKEIESWRSLLARDFDVGDGGDAAALVEALRNTIEEGVGDPDAAVLLVRAAHVASGAAGVGLVDRDLALGWANTLVELARGRFGSWAALGAAFLEGERSAPGSNMLGRKLLARVVKRLGDDERSPWRKLAWPS